MKIPTSWQWNKWRWPLGVLALVIISTSVIGRYLPWLLAQVWYLRHMNGVTYMGKVIPVPRGMVGSVEKNLDANFLQFPSAMSKTSVRIGWGMHFSRDSVPHRTPEDALERLGANLRILAARTGNPVGPAFEVETQEGKGWCYTTTVNPGKTVITNCLLFDARWEAMYSGPLSHEREFFKVVAGIHDAKE